MANSIYVCFPIKGIVWMWCASFLFNVKRNFEYLNWSVHLTFDYSVTTWEFNILNVYMFAIHFQSIRFRVRSTAAYFYIIHLYEWNLKWKCWTFYNETIFITGNSKYKIRSVSCSFKPTLQLKFCSIWQKQDFEVFLIPEKKNLDCVWVCFHTWIHSFLRTSMMLYLPFYIIVKMCFPIVVQKGFIKFTHFIGRQCVVVALFVGFYEGLFSLE